MRRSGEVAIGLVGMLAGPAFAGDLPTFVRTPPPAQVGCGIGAEFLSGTKTCLRLNGAIWADLKMTRPTLSTVQTPAPLPLKSQTLGGSQPLAHAYVSADTRTPTSLGDFRTFVSIRAPGKGF